MSSLVLKATLLAVVLGGWKLDFLQKYSKISRNDPLLLLSTDLGLDFSKSLCVVVDLCSKVTSFFLFLLFFCFFFLFCFLFWFWFLLCILCFCLYIKVLASFFARIRSRVFFSLRVFFYDPLSDVSREGFYKVWVLVVTMAVA